MSQPELIGNPKWMDSNRLIDALLHEQHRDGYFKSTIHWGKRRYTSDCNGFMTALVLRELSEVDKHLISSAMIGNAMDYLKHCRSSTFTGGYRFWPEDQSPKWGVQLPADADDTALMLKELAHYSELDFNTVKRHAVKALTPYRLKTIKSSDPPWLKKGVFLTWLADVKTNVVDCCVNANVLALLAYLELKDLPGYSQACTMINDAVLWAGNSVNRAQSLSPFYSHPMELLFAVKNAIYYGTDELRPCSQLIQQAPWAYNPLDYQSPICCSAYGLIEWFSPAVHFARQLL